MNRLRYILCLSVIFVLMIHPVQAEDSLQNKLLEQARQLKTSGQLHEAYTLLNQAQDGNTEIQLQLALLAYLLGREQQANRLFNKLLANKNLPSEVKRNITRFRLTFAVSLQKQLKQAQLMSKQGSCDKALPKFKYLLAFNKTRIRASRGLNTCKQNMTVRPASASIKALGYQVQINYRLGQDSNVEADNQELLTPGTTLLNDSYDYIQVKLGYKWRAKIMSKRVDINPVYSYSQKQFSSPEVSRYDTDINKVQLNLTWRSPGSVMWRLPMSSKWLALGGERYVRYQELAPNVSWPHKLAATKGRSRIKWKIKYRQYDNPVYEGRDGVSHTLDYQLSFKVLGDVKIKPGIWYRQQATQTDESRAYTASAVKLSAQVMQNEMRYSLWYQYGNYQYQAADSVLAASLGASYKQPRHNRRSDIRGSIRYQIMPNWQVFLRVNYTTQSSNQALYEFNRLKSELGLSIKF